MAAEPQPSDHVGSLHRISVPQAFVVAFLRGSSISSSELVSDWNQAITFTDASLRMTIENKESRTKQFMSIHQIKLPNTARAQ